MKKETEKTEKYVRAVGRRKTSIARVVLLPSKEMTIVVNGKEYISYFPTRELHALVKEPFEKAEISSKFAVSAKLSGGGIHGQAEALRHGISRALIIFDAELRKKLKKEGFLRRDPRAKERKKFGLKKARRAPQWSKR